MLMLQQEGNINTTHQQGGGTPHAWHKVDSHSIRAWQGGAADVS